jgi:uncharacterized integral membrane protein
MLGLIFAAPFFLFLILFALSNQQSVSFGLWPTDLSVQAPLSLAVLGAGGIFFILGALVVGINSVAQRRRARRAERRVRMLENELEDLRPRRGARPTGTGTAVQVIGL